MSISAESAREVCRQACLKRELLEIRRFIQQACESRKQEITLAKLSNDACAMLVAAGYTVFSWEEPVGYRVSWANPLEACTAAGGFLPKALDCRRVFAQHVWKTIQESAASGKNSCEFVLHESELEQAQALLPELRDNGYDAGLEGILLSVSF